MNGATGTGSLLVGTPVSANLTSTPTSSLAGTTTVTNSLQINAQTPLGLPFGLVGQAPSAGAIDARRFGDFVYVSGSNGIGVFNVAGANLNVPKLIRTFGTSTYELEIRGTKLYAMRSTSINFEISIYSLADPSNPQLLGATGAIPYAFAGSMLVTDDHVYVVNFNIIYFIGSNDVFDQNGAVVAIDVSNPASPHVDGDAITAKGTPAGRDGVNDGVLYNENGTSDDGVKFTFGIDQSGGNRNTWDAIQIDANTLLVTGSTATGTDTQTGSGVIHVVDISDPKNMKVVKELNILERCKHMELRYKEVRFS